MGCYSCTIRRETSFYQQKQGYPNDDHIDFTDKNTRKHTLHLSIFGDIETYFAPKYTRGPRLKG